MADNLGGNDGQQDDSELSAVRRHRKKKKAAELDLGINLEQINHNLKLAESENEIVKSKLSIMNEICGIDSIEFINNKWMIGNQNELNKISEKREEINSVTPNSNEITRSRHQREKRKRLLELQEQELNVKRRRIEYLHQEEMLLTPILNSRKANMIKVYRKKM